MDLHVAIVSRGIPTFRFPMQGIFEWDQAKALVEAGVQVDFLVVDLRSFRRLRPWGIRSGENDGIRWHAVSFPVGRIPLSWLCRIGGIALRCLYKKVFPNVDNRPDIIHAHFFEQGYMAMDIALENRVPLVITEHASDMNEMNVSDEIKQIARQAYRHADCVIAVGETLRRNIYRHAGVNAKIVPNIVASDFRCVRSVHREFVFVSVGTLIMRKRMHLLIEAFAICRKMFDNIKLIIIGDGDQRSRLKTLAKRLCVSDNVVFCGELARQQIKEIYKSCDCFVLPSAVETFGVSCIEAMAAGLPVIATRCGGPEDFVTEENGLLVDVDDVEALKDAMMSMYTLRNQYDYNAISANTIDHFSASNIAKQLIKIYNEELERKRPA
ncbi:MAG: glycosyltransferase family 4 protein [Schwartzia succinivorans]|nr:glycosyltransferase family 4 protein [Schwartzia succinivorans]